MPQQQQITGLVGLIRVRRMQNARVGDRQVARPYFHVYLVGVVG